MDMIKIKSYFLDLLDVIVLILCPLSFHTYCMMKLKNRTAPKYQILIYERDCF